MKSWSALPALHLEASSPIGSAFAMRGVNDLREAGRYLYRLPYGRNSDRSDFTLVLSEGRGTCSTKHALLAALAREQGIPIRLMLGIYEMREANTPGWASSWPSTDWRASLRQLVQQGREALDELIRMVAAGGVLPPAHVSPQTP